LGKLQIKTTTDEFGASVGNVQIGRRTTSGVRPSTLTKNNFNGTKTVSFRGSENIKIEKLRWVT
jgi:hypothetical protein